MPPNLPENEKEMQKNVKYRKVLSFSSFLDQSGVFGVHQKSKNFTNTHRMVLIIRQLNYLGEILQIRYKFGAWQFL